MLLVVGYIHFMLTTGIAPDWMCIAFALAAFVLMPLDAWLRAWPAAIKDRDHRTRPRYHHEPNTRGGK